MKRSIALFLALAMVLGLTACGGSTPNTAEPSEGTAVHIALADDGIHVDGSAISTQSGEPVYAANDIIYYEAGHDFTYGKGTEADAHTADEANAHTVVHITQPGTYTLSGKLSAGQIAVDLGEDAEDDPAAVVTLILDGVDITCTVAPAVIFYNVYECGDKDNPTKDVDTSAAGANVIIADGTSNFVNGSYVARIYRPETVELNADGTEVETAKKLHKYDGAFYSKMSMNISGGGEGDGVLHITADNEGLDTELHLTINGGVINISSGNDGINTNEDGVSVTTINGGSLTVNVTGETGEGDGIDSNGWIVINGGTVIAAACSTSMDAGIDSDMGIHINGGTVIATGNMLDHIADGGQNYAVFSFRQRQSGDNIITLQNSDGGELMALWPVNDYSVLVYSSPDLAAGDYTLYSNNALLAHSTAGGGFGGGFGGMMPPGQEGGDGTPPADFDPQQGQPPELPEGMEFPAEGSLPERPAHMDQSEAGTPPELPPHDGHGRHDDGTETEAGALNSVFTIADGANQFGGVTTAE